MSKLVAKAKILWPEIVTGALWLWANFGPSALAYIETHPALALKIGSTLSAIAIYAARLSTSPVAQAAAQGSQPPSA